MKIEGSYTFEAPRDLVWTTIRDPEVLANTLPGAQDLQQIGDDEYKTAMNVRIGPVQGLFSGTVKLSDVHEPESYRLAVDGKGAPGFVKGEGNLRLEAQDGQTVLHYDGEVQVGGRLASVGQRLMESSAQAMIRQSLESLDAQVEARLRGEITGEEVVAPAPPSEMAYAAGVTRKMLEDMVPPEQRQTLLAGGLAAIALILLFWLINNWWMDRLANRVAKKLEKRGR